MQWGYPGLHNFGGLWFAYLAAPSTDNYTFYMSSDNGALLYVDSALVVNISGRFPALHDHMQKMQVHHHDFVRIGTVLHSNLHCPTLMQTHTTV